MKSEQDVLDYLNGGYRFSQYFDGHGLNTDGLYGWQCKDLDNDIAFWFGHPLTAGDAVTAWTDDQDQFYQKIPYSPDIQLQLGDLAVFKFNHICIVMEAYPTSFLSLDQNWFNSNSYMGSPPAWVLHPIDNNLYGVLRPQLKGGSMEKQLNDGDRANIASAAQVPIEQVNQQSWHDVFYGVIAPVLQRLGTESVFNEGDKVNVAAVLGIDGTEVTGNWNHVVYMLLLPEVQRLAARVKELESTNPDPLYVELGQLVKAIANK